MEACMNICPKTPNVAVFDIGFHKTLPEYVYRYAIPTKYYDEYKIHRYGAHGTSHYYVTQRCADIMGKKPENLNMVSCHIGSGASICAVKNGKSCKECDKNNVITDRKGISFQIRCRMGFSELFNSVPIWLADRKNELLGLDFNVLYFTDETKERAAEVLSAYENGLSPDVKYTRGLFWRGTI